MATRKARQPIVKWLPMGLPKPLMDDLFKHGVTCPRPVATRARQLLKMLRTELEETGFTMVLVEQVNLYIRNQHTPQGKLVWQTWLAVAYRALIMKDDASMAALQLVIMLQELEDSLEGRE